MKKRITAGLLLSAALLTASAQCRVDLNVVTPQGDDVPEAVLQALEARIGSMLTAMGDAAVSPSSPFFVTAKITNKENGVLPGPPQQHRVKTDLTFYLGNSLDRTVYQSLPMTLNGVGNSEQQAFQNALHVVNAKNSNLRNFLQNGSEQIVAYYDKHAPQIKKQAQRAADTGEYGKALFLLTQVPECSSAYNELSSDVKRCYTLYADREGDMLLKQAQTAWAADPTPAGALAAASILEQIPVGSKAEKGAEKLYSEMTAQLKDDNRFEYRQKYADSLDLEKRKLDAARQVGVAWGNGQKPNTTILPFLK